MLSSPRRPSSTIRILSSADQCRRVVMTGYSCFWHRHPGCRYATTPGSNIEFWNTKFATNVNRDASKEQAPIAAGWRVAVVWECTVRRNLDAEAGTLLDWIRGTDECFEG
jgi:DNA mismatch endonuclease, patch repair protein